MQAVKWSVRDYRRANLKACGMINFGVVSDQPAGCELISPKVVEGQLVDLENDQSKTWRSDCTHTYEEDNF